MARTSSSKPLVQVAFLELQGKGIKPSIRKIAEYIKSQSGTNPSPNMISAELKAMRLRNPELFTDASEAEEHHYEGSTQTQLQSPSNPRHQAADNGYIRELAELRLKHSMLEASYKLLGEENRRLNDVVRKQNESMIALNDKYSEQIQGLAKDAMNSMISSTENLNKQIDELLKARETDRTQWEGLRRHLMSETDRMRELEASRLTLMKGKLRDSEQMVFNLTQLKNALEAELSDLKQKFRVPQSRDHNN